MTSTNKRFQVAKAFTSCLAAVVAFVCCFCGEERAASMSADPSPPIAPPPNDDDGDLEFGPLLSSAEVRSDDSGPMPSASRPPEVEEEEGKRETEALSNTSFPTNIVVTPAGPMEDSEEKKEEVGVPTNAASIEHSIPAPSEDIDEDDVGAVSVDNSLQGSSGNGTGSGSTSRTGSSDEIPIFPGLPNEEGGSAAFVYSSDDSNENDVNEVEANATLADRRPRTASLRSIDSYLAQEAVNRDHFSSASESVEATIRTGSNSGEVNANLIPHNE